MNKYRSHTCGELTSKDKDKNVSLSGWINKKRDHGNLLFLDLRDNYGVTQCVIDNNHKKFGHPTCSSYSLEITHQSQENMVNT